MMNKTEYLLTCVQEECAEIIQACSKAKRFGLGIGYPDSKTNNAQDIMIEYIDLLSIMEMLLDETDIMDDKYWGSEIPNIKDMISKKKEKVNHYMELSREKGCLENE